MKNSTTAIGSTGLGLLCAMTLVSSGLLFGQSWADDAISPPSSTNDVTTPNTSTPTINDVSTPITSPNNNSNPSSSSTTTSTSSNSTSSTTSISDAIGQTMLSSSANVIVEPDTALSQLPHILVGQGTSMVHVINPSPNTVTFASTGLNISTPVPPNSQRTIQITPAMAANLTPGQEVAYSINDSDGNILASSNFITYPTIASQETTNTTATSEQYNESNNNQPSTSNNEPSTTNTNTGRSAVRGYW